MKPQAPQGPGVGVGTKILVIAFSISIAAIILGITFKLVRWIIGL